jgi:hypothetical protein
VSPPRRAAAAPLRPQGRPALTPHRPGPATPDALAAWLAGRLYARHRGEPVRVLEAIAGVLVRRLALDGPAGAPSPVPLPAGDPHAAVCRRVARRALAGGTGPAETAGATRYHNADIAPPWALDRVPLATVGGFHFYA